MKIERFDYCLTSGSSLNAASQTNVRRGALLKFTFSDKLIGYSDCHPWTELGDLPLEEQLSLLSQNKITPLIQASRENAKKDARARSKNISLLADQTIPKSHFLIVNLLECERSTLESLKQEGFTHLKIKVGRNVEAESQQLLTLFLNAPFKLRLDFNETLNREQFDQFCSKMEPLKERIEFIEDPFPFEEQEWTDFQNQGWRLAADRQAIKALDLFHAAKFLILKPSQRPLFMSNNQDIIVTSNLAHPLDQQVAAYFAATIGSKNHVHGLLSHRAYLPYSPPLNRSTSGPDFIVTEGLGYGLDDYLHHLEWKPLL